MDEFLACQERRRRREKAMKCMADDVQWLLNQPAGSVTWDRSQNDLIDLIDCVWAMRVITGKGGKLMTRKAIAEKVFATVGRTCPKRLTQAVWDVRNRRLPEHSMMQKYMVEK